MPCEKNTALNMSIVIVALISLVVTTALGGFTLLVHAADDYDERDEDMSKATVYYTVSGGYDLDMEAVL